MHSARAGAVAAAATPATELAGGPVKLSVKPVEPVEPVEPAELPVTRNMATTDMPPLLAMFNVREPAFSDCLWVRLKDK
jgi:hypothetical protein